MFEISEMFTIAVAAVLGLVLGGFYFGGLWWTVRRMPRTRAPLSLYFGSLAVRLALVLTAFYGVLTYSSWLPLVASLIGFLVARIVLTRSLGRAASSKMPQHEAI